MVISFFSRYLIICLTLLCVMLSNHIVFGDGPPTQAHPVWYPTTYLPLKRGHKVAGQPIVQTTLDGTQSAAFLVDTGAGGCFLSPEVAQRLRLKLQPAFLDDGSPYLFKGKQAFQVSPSTMKIGNLTLTLNPSHFRVLDDQNFMLFPNKNSDDTLFDGILGVNFLQLFAVLVDASQNLLGLCLPGNIELNQLGSLGYTSVYIIPLVHKDGLWYVTVQLTNNGISQNEDLVLDTGSDFTTISDTAATHLGLNISEEHATTNIYSNNVPMGGSSVDTMQIGGITLSGHHVSVAHVSKLEPPVLGMDILSGYRVLIDFPGKKMYLQSNTAAAIPALTVGPQTPGQGAGKQRL